MLSDVAHRKLDITQIHIENKREKPTSIQKETNTVPSNEQVSKRVFGNKMKTKSEEEMKITKLKTDGGLRKV